MKALFGPPDMPAAQPLPVQPTTDDARQAEDDIMRLRRRRGRQSTFLAGRFGKPSVAAGASMLGASGAMSSGGRENTGGGGGGAGSAPQALR